MGFFFTYLLLVEVLHYCEQDENTELMTNKQNPKAPNGYFGERDGGWAAVKQDASVFIQGLSGLSDLS